MTGGIIQSDVYSGREQTCLLCNIKLLCIHPMKQPNRPANMKCYYCEKCK